MHEYEWRTERCALVVIIAHGVHGRHMEQVRAGHSIHQMDVRQQMEQRQYTYNTKMHCEMEQQQQAMQ